MVYHKLRCSPSFVCVKLSTKEKISQPSKSLNIADAIITIPIFVLNKFISIRILAITGKAEIDSAVPKNNANNNFGPCSLLIENISGKNQATAKPVKKGITMLNKLVYTATFPCLRTKDN